MMVEEGGAPHAARLQHAGGVGVRRALSGPRQPRDGGPVDLDLAGAHGRRRHDGQLDVVVSHARLGRWRCGPPATAWPASTPRRWRRTSRRSRPGCRSGPAIPTTSTPTTGSCWRARASSGWNPELIRRSVKGCGRLGYCGMGCPGRREAVGADHVRSGRAGGRRAPVHERPRQADRNRSGPRQGRRVRRDRLRCHPPPKPALRGVRAARRRPRRRRHQYTRLCCCGRRSSTRTMPSGGARSCTRPCRSWRTTTSPSKASIGAAPIGRLPSLRRPRRARRLLARDRADSSHAVRGGIVGLRRCSPEGHGAPGARTGDDRVARRRPPRRRGRARRRRSSTSGFASPTRCRRRCGRPATDAIKNMARLQLAAGAREMVTLHEDPVVDPVRGRSREARRRRVRSQSARLVLGAPDGRRGDGRGPGALGREFARDGTTNSRTCG
jgi:hypothetical protein